MQEIMYYLLFSSYKNHFLVQIYVDLFIPKRKSGQVFHACVLGMLIRLIRIMSVAPVLPCYQLSPGTNYRQTEFK